MRLRLLTAVVLALICLPAGLAAAAEPQQRIVGGNPTAPGEYPWTVALVVSSLPAERGQFCGGSLIEPDLVLTAAHCLEGQAPQDIDVVAGRWRLAERNGERIDSARLATDPRYAPDTSSHDVGLIELARPASQPTVTLSTEADAPLFAPGEPARVLGWGTLQSGGPETADVLYETDVDFISNESCDEDYAVAAGGPGAIDETMICAAAPGRDSCQGDSGGPLVIDEAAGWHQVGVVSFGIGCADPDFPGVYARVPALLDFIQDPDPVWAPVPVAPPLAKGDARVGGKLHCRRGRWAGEGVQYSYFWNRIRLGEVRQAVGGEQNLRVTKRLRGWRVACFALAYNDGGFAEAQSANAVRLTGP